MKQTEKSPALTVTEININKAPTQIEAISLIGDVRIEISPQIEEKIFADPSEIKPESHVTLVKDGPHIAPKPSVSITKAKRDQGQTASPKSASQKTQTSRSFPEITTPQSSIKRKGFYVIAGGLAAVLVLATVGFTMVSGQGDPVVQNAALDGRELGFDPVVKAPTHEEFLQFVSAASAADLSEVEATTANDLISQMAAGALITLRTHAAPEPEAPAAQPVETPADAAGNVVGNPTGALSDLYLLIVTAHSEGHSRDHIDGLINTAYQKGEISVPQGLISDDGRVDTQSILSLFIAQ